MNLNLDNLISSLKSVSKTIEDDCDTFDEKIKDFFEKFSFKDDTAMLKARAELERIGQYNREVLKRSNDFTKKYNEIISKEENKVGIIVFGVTGSGKSTIVKSLLKNEKNIIAQSIISNKEEKGETNYNFNEEKLENLDKIKISHANEGCTTKVIKYCSDKCIIYDTIGFDDKDIGDNAIFEELKRCITYKIDKIIIVTKNDRMPRRFCNLVKRLEQKCFGEKCNNISIVKTNCSLGITNKNYKLEKTSEFLNDKNLKRYTIKPCDIIFSEIKSTEGLQGSFKKMQEELNAMSEKELDKLLVKSDEPLYMNVTINSIFKEAEKWLNIVAVNTSLYSNYMDENNLKKLRKVTLKYYLSKFGNGVATLGKGVVMFPVVIAAGTVVGIVVGLDKITGNHVFKYWE